MAKRDGELKGYDFSSCVGRTRKMAIELPQLVRNCQYLKIVDSAIEIYAGPWIQLFLVLFVQRCKTHACQKAIPRIIVNNILRLFINKMNNLQIVLGLTFVEELNCVCSDPTDLICCQSNLGSFKRALPHSRFSS